MTCKHENIQHDERVKENYCTDCCEWQTDKKPEGEIKYYKYDILERLGDYENNTRGLFSISESADLGSEGYRMAMEWRGSEPEDYDESMDAYWFDGQGVVFPADFEEISKETFDVLIKHLNAL